MGMPWLLLLNTHSRPGCCLSVRSAGWVSVVVTTLAVAASAWLYAAYLFFTADADLGLLLRGRHRENAFADKVVWVTGASQVRGWGRVGVQCYRAVSLWLHAAMLACC
jgi:hypothetical protein